MAKFREKEKAIRLRKLGKSYREIKLALSVSKGTLSSWLKNYPLPPDKIRALRDNSARRIEHYRATRTQKRLSQLDIIYHEQRRKILPISQNALLIGGLCLYWGEGGKSTLPRQIAFSNTDPAMAKFFIFWLKKIFNIEKNKIHIRMHFYNDMEIHKETRYWSDMLKIPVKQFAKPYIKTSKLNSLSYKRGFGHGTCNIFLYDAMLGKKIAMSIKAIADHAMDC